MAKARKPGKKKRNSKNEAKNLKRMTQNIKVLKSIRS